MFLSADALDILAYLRTAPGKFFSMPEISRFAAGRRRFEDSPSWARSQMTPLLDAGLVEINARGHYCVPNLAKAVRHPEASPTSPLKREPKIMDGGYSSESASRSPRIVGDDYFPSSD